MSNTAHIDDAYIVTYFVHIIPISPQIAIVARLVGARVVITRDDYGEMGIREHGHDREQEERHPVDNVSTVASVKMDETRTRASEEKGGETQLAFLVNPP